MEAGESIEKAEAGTDSQWVSKMPQEVVLSCQHKKKLLLQQGVLCTSLCENVNYLTVISLWR